MAFIRKRISPSKRQTPSYQIIETFRDNGKVRQRVLANLGSNATPELALKEFRRELANIHRLIEGYRAELSDNGTSPASRRRLDRWRRASARQQEAVQKIECFLASGKHLGLAKHPFPSNHSSSSNFLEWVIERNSSGWLQKDC